MLQPGFQGQIKCKSCSCLHSIDVSRNCSSSTAESGSIEGKKHLYRNVRDELNHNCGAAMNDLLALIPIALQIRSVQLSLGLSGISMVSLWVFAPECSPHAVKWFSNLELKCGSWL